MLRRNVTPLLLDALADTPVVLLHGARQTGKTTLVRAVAEEEHPARYLTLDDPAVRAAALADPQGFVDQAAGPVVIDEVQRVPELALAIKAAVDQKRRPGRFLLTGSANVLQVPRLSESLAGRMEILTLWPFSQGEIAGVHETFIDTLFAGRFPRLGTVEKKGRPIAERLLKGGYPEARQRKSEQRRRAWFAAYIDTILQRDVRDLANIEGLTALPRLLALLATRASSLLNYADLARSIQIPQTTFLIQLLPPWSSNLGLRLVKSPKLYLSDSGLLVYLLGVDRERLGADPTQLGHVLENFVVTELRKQAAWSKSRPRLFHYRTQTGREVDIVLEGNGGRIVGLEIKAGLTITSGDFKGLRHLANTVGERFRRGVLLYGGTETLPFGKRLHACPLESVWS
ncbi:MAG: ATP-binding protein [Phycisphaerae bacterium]|nr:ATP-binding protein [Phycisphaerae bacterium]